MSLITKTIKLDKNKNTVIKLVENLADDVKSIIVNLYSDKSEYCTFPVSDIRKSLELNKKVIKHNRYDFLDDTKSKTGVYIFINSESVPVYIGKGGVGEKDDLKRRIINECKLNPEEDSGAIPSKNIKKHFLLLNMPKTESEIIAILNSWKVICIPIGDKVENNKAMATYLESLLILIYKPKFNLQG